MKSIIVMSFATALVCSSCSSNSTTSTEATPIDTTKGVTGTAADSIPRVNISVIDSTN